MTTDPTDLRERIMAALRQATDDGANTTEDYADAVLPIVQEAQAAVLRERAQRIRSVGNRSSEDDELYMLGARSAQRKVADWLDISADNIERSTDDE